MSADPLAALLHGPLPATPVDALAPWWEAHRELPRVASMWRAALGGFGAAGMAWAFASGYQEAMRALASRIDAAPAPDLRRALCATEAGGNHPRAIETRLRGDAAPFVLEGEKTYVSLGPAAEALWVIAQRAEPRAAVEGRKRLVAVRVEATAPGVELEALPPGPFVPELPHARVRFREVEVHAAMCVEGDGYLRVLKPFRTIEDLHVMAAVLGQLIAQMRRAGAKAELLEGTVFELAAFVELGRRPDPLDPALHRALAAGLAGLSARVDAWREAGAYVNLPAEMRARFERDLALLQVAGRAREARLARAREAAVQGEDT